LLAVSLRATGRAGGEGKDGGHVHKGLLSATMISVFDMMEDEFVCLSDYGNLPPFGLKGRVRVIGIGRPTFGDIVSRSYGRRAMNRALRL